MTLLIAIVALQTFAFVEGIRLARADPLIKLGAGPFVGHWDVRFALTAVPAVLVAGLGVMVLPQLTERASMALAVVASAASSVAFTLLLAASDGWHAVVRPVLDPTEYWASVATAKPAGRYLRDYLVDQHLGSIHVQGHPPALLLALIGLRSVGLGSVWVAASLSFVGAALSIVGVAVTAVRFGAVHLLPRRPAVPGARPVCGLAGHVDGRVLRRRLGDRCRRAGDVHDHHLGPHPDRRWFVRWRGARPVLLPHVRHTDAAAVDRRARLAGATLALARPVGRRGGGRRRRGSPRSATGGSTG